MTGTATSPNIIFKESRRREGVGRRREGVARELGNREEKVQRHAGRRRGVNARKSSGTLAVEDDFDESKPSRRWPATMRSTEGESGEWTMKRVCGPRKESSDHEKSLRTTKRVRGPRQGSDDHVKSPSDYKS